MKASFPIIDVTVCLRGLTVDLRESQGWLFHRCKTSEDTSREHFS